MKCMKAMGPEMDGSIAGPALKKAPGMELAVGWLDLASIVVCNNVMFHTLLDFVTLLICCVNWVWLLGWWVVDQLFGATGTSLLQRCKHQVVGRGPSFWCVSLVIHGHSLLILRPVVIISSTVSRLYSSFAVSLLLREYIYI